MVILCTSFKLRMTSWICLCNISSAISWNLGARSTNTTSSLSELGKSGRYWDRSVNFCELVMHLNNFQKPFVFRTTGRELGHTTVTVSLIKTWGRKRTKTEANLDFLRHKRKVYPLNFSQNFILKNKKIEADSKALSLLLLTRFPLILKGSNK